MDESIKLRWIFEKQAVNIETGESCPKDVHKWTAVVNMAINPQIP